MNRRYILCQVREAVPTWAYMLARLLFPLVVRDYHLREAGRRPDRLYWADFRLMRLGFVVLDAA